MKERHQEVQIEKTGTAGDLEKGLKVLNRMIDTEVLIHVVLKVVLSKQNNQKVQKEVLVIKLVMTMNNAVITKRQK